MGRPRVQDYGKLIELPVQRKLLSLLAGRHGGTGAGASHEFLDMAEYKAGDDVGDIDWKSTAKLTQPVMKRFEQTAVLNVVLAVDTGSNMAALAPGPPPPAIRASGVPQAKEDVAAELVGALAWLTAHRGDLLGLVAGSSAELKALPARSGAIHAQTLQSLALSGEPTGAPGDFTAVLRRVDATRRGRALVIGITDVGQLDSVDERYLKRVAERHKLMMVLVQDADPARVTGSGGLRDVAAGAIPDFVKENPAVASEWASPTTPGRRKT